MRKVTSEAKSLRDFSEKLLAALEAMKSLGFASAMKSAHFVRAVKSLGFASAMKQLI